MMPTGRTNPRAEYRLRQSQLVQESVSLAEKFPRLKGLTVNLAYFDSEGVNKNSEMKYKVNVNHAKSMFCFVCQSGECVGADFDLSAAPTKSLTGPRNPPMAQTACRGSPNKGDRAKCLAQCA